MTIRWGQQENLTQHIRIGRENEGRERKGDGKGNKENGEMEEIARWTYI